MPTTPDHIQSHPLRGRLLVLLALLAPAAAAAGPTAADYLRASTPAVNAVNRAGQEQDEKFFTVKGAPPNMMFLLDTSGSMRNLVIPPRQVISQGTACDNAVYNAIITAGGFLLAGDYPPPDLGVPAGAPNGFPELFRQDSVYIAPNPDTTNGGNWDETRGYPVSVDEACNFGALDPRTEDCKKCMKKKFDGGTGRGYYLDPLRQRDVFHGKFLNFYPPRFVTARTTLKRVIYTTRSVRMGVSAFASSAIGAKKVADLGPSCRQTLEPDNANWESSRGSILSKISNTSTCDKADTGNAVCFKGEAPLAEALLDIGYYFTNEAAVYDAWFGPGWTRKEMAGGSITSEDRSVCYGCQVSSVVIISDGAPSGDNCVPDCIKAVGATCSGCDQKEGECLPAAGACRNACQNSGTCTKGGTQNCCVNGAPNYLDDVAQWLYEHDLQTKNPNNGEWSADGRQKLVTYTVGFTVEQPLLVNTAAVSGGRYFTANDRTSLEEALQSIINDVNRRATTFGVSSISTLQTASGIDAYVPRFIPGTQGEEWRGFLYMFDVGNEMINGCVPTATAEAAHPKDLNKDHDCNDVLYVDKDGDVAEEDALTGMFLKRGTNIPARPLWEAGRELTYTSPTYRDPETRDDTTPGKRNIWTVVDSNGDGKLDRTDEMVEFTPANAARLMPYLGFGMDVTNEPFCQSAYSRLGVTSPALSAWGEECAKVLINYYRGYRSISSDPMLRSTARPWLLADIFHSSPIELFPPVRPGMCPFRRQCLTSVYFHGCAQANDLDQVAFDAYNSYLTGDYCGGGKPCEERRKLVLVGSNGGFLHAFDAGGKDSSLPPEEERDPFTKELRFTAGTGKEVWAFIPPDLLGVLRHGVGRHTYFLDGTPQVRDIWVDGDTLSLGNGQKEPGEFRSVVVMGSRTGGPHYFALDVTRDVSGQTKPRPQFLWMWPQPSDPLTARVGDSWSTFFPKPPPIVPVLLDASTTGHGSGFTFKSWLPRADGSAEWDPIETKAQERWVVGFSGGYDRSLLRGRGVAVVDVWSGLTLWNAFHTPGSGDMHAKLEWPMSAAMAFNDTGNANPFESPVDACFDAFHVGDYGGNLWVGRLYEPGKWNGQTVTNWHLARAFQTMRDDGASVRNRRPITTITESAGQGTNLYLRTFVGTGDRASLLDRNGGTCSLDDPYTCVAMGCRVTSYLWQKNVPDGEWVTSTVWQNGQVQSHTRQKLSGCVNLACFAPREASCFTECTGTSCSAAALGCPGCAGQQACLSAARSACSATCTDASLSNALTSQTRVSQCPTSTTNATSTTTLERVVRVRCTNTAGNPNCVNDTLRNSTVEVGYLASAVSALPTHRFFGVHTLNSRYTPARWTFNTAAGATAFDDARLTDKPAELTDLGALSTPATSGTGTPVKAPEDGHGWYITYDSKDERTASAASTPMRGLEDGSLCIVWNTMTPSAVGNICGGSGSQVAKLVQADFVTGDPNCIQEFAGTANPRYALRTALVPPTEPTAVVAVGGGKIITGMMQAEPGGDPTMVRGHTETDLIQSLYQLELSPQEHACRHKESSCGP